MTPGTFPDKFPENTEDSSGSTPGISWHAISADIPYHRRSFVAPQDVGSD
jgi:hypothetical protein